MNSFRNNFFGDILKTLSFGRPSEIKLTQRKQEIKNNISTTKSPVIITSVYPNSQLNHFYETDDDISICSFPEEDLDIKTYTSLDLRKF